MRRAVVQEEGRVSQDGFEVICEIESPISADLSTVHEQVAALQRSCDGFLVPDCHLGRATVSSVAVAREVACLQGRALACINARDRNLLGLRRDLLTAAAYGLDELLFVYGDRPRSGDRSTLRVRQMLEEARRREYGRGFRIGVTADVSRELAPWKREADFVCTQVSFDEQALVRWRDRVGFDGAVYAGVVVLASDRMARRLQKLMPGFEVPDGVMRDLARDPEVGVELAIEQLHRLRDSQAAEGAHLVPARRYRQTAEALERSELRA